MLPHHPSLAEAAERLYRPDLPYHSFDHVRQVLGFAELILGRCREERIEVDPEVVYLALLFHDAGYHENSLAKGFHSKEEYSAELAAAELERAGVAAATREKVRRAILSTWRDAHFGSNEEKAVRAADLWGLGLDYATFRANAMALMKEYEMLQGHPIAWERWKAHVAKIVEGYTSREIRLTSDFEPEGGESPFRRRVRANLARLARDPG